ncbi:MAG TPA: L-aspartate oxidase, partial [Zetaproteobacteria bacterium]|nr:L-aspartate oxidase [Zetaproteobacteria bacterium]
MQNRYEFDYLIIGSGAAGLFAASKLAEHGKVAVVNKGEFSESNTWYAQGGIAGVMDATDSVEHHVSDTLQAGCGLCHEDAVRNIIGRGNRIIEELISFGTAFDSDNGVLHLTREAAHSHRRIAHAKDATGKAVGEALLAPVARNPNIKAFPRHMAVDVITARHLGRYMQGPDRCFGAYVLAPDGEVITIAAKHTILATGGAGKVYLFTSNPHVATGDGVAMAWRAGCPVMNMEFIQFHPTCLYHPQAKSFLITEAMRGEGAILRLPDGTRFMESHDERLELAPRDIVARAIDFEMKKRGLDCVFLDITHQPAKFIVTHFPNIYARCKELGIDITQEWIPIAPAAHYTCGGIVIDRQGRTDIDNLYAIGETTCTGLHGANRLASNSLLECLVYGRAAAANIAQSRPASAPALRGWDESRVTDADEQIVITHNWHELRSFMWDYV